MGPASKPAPPATPDRPARGSLKLRVFSDGGELWRALREEFQTPASPPLTKAPQAVFSGPLSRQSARRWLSDGSAVLRGERLIDVSQLWDELARALRSDSGAPPIPKALAGPELLSELTQLIEDRPSLSYLSSHPSGVAELSAHVSRLEAWADEGFEPGSETEREIAELISSLAERGLATYSGLRSIVARSAWRCELNRKLIFAPLPDLHPQLGGLLRALRYSCEVHAFLISDPDHVQMTLEMIGLAGNPSAELHCSWAERGSSLSWRVSDDELSDAIRSIREWERDGADPARMAIVTPSTEAVSFELIERARAQETELVVRDRVDALETEVSSALLAVIRSELSEPVDLQLLRERYGYSSEQLQSLRELEGSPVELLRELLRIGREMTEREPPPLSQDAERGVIWLDELEKQLSSHDEISLVAPGAELDPESFLTQLAPPRQIRGPESAAMVLAPNEAAGAPLERVAVVGIEAMESESFSAFVSAKTRSERPEIEQPDWRPIWSSLRGAASVETRLIRSRGSAALPAHPPAAWLMALTQEPPEELEWRPKAAPLKTLTQKQRWGRRLSRAASDKGALAESLLTEPRPYTVTELERYLSCPLGWLVSRALEPRSPDAAAAARGSVAHMALAAAIAKDPPERAAAAAKVIQREGPRKGIRRRARRALERQTERVLELYAGGAWAWGGSLAEQELAGEISLDDGSVIEVGGRADRIDVRDGGSLGVLSGRERLALGLGGSGSARRGSEQPDHEEPVDLGYDEDGTPIAPASAAPASAPPDAARPARELLIIDYKLGDLPDTSRALQAYVYPILAAGALSEEELPAVVRAFLYVSLRQGRSSALTLGGSPPPELTGAESRSWISGWAGASKRISEAVEGITSGKWDQIGSGCKGWCPHHLISETGGRAGL